MSDVNLDFTVDNNNINISVDTTDITFTPSDIQLSIYAGGYAETATGLNADIANVHIYGGVNGYVLQTDGSGTLSWTAQTGGGGGNGTPGGANTQIQFNDAGSFGGNTGFTFNSITGNVNIPGNLYVTGGTIVGVVANANYATYSGTAFSVNGSNVVGAVANATYADTAAVATNVTGNAQSNITSVGTLSSLSVTGNISTANSIVASKQLISNIATGTAPLIVYSTTPVANLTVNNASYATTAGSATTATSATTAGTVTTAAQPNITSVGTLGNLSVTGTGSFGNITISNNATVGGMLKIAPAQEKVTISTSTTFNTSTQGILFNTSNAAANVTLAFTNANTNIGNANSFVGTYLMTNGATPYQVTDITIDGSYATVLWFNGVAPTTYANTITAYTFTIIKTSTTPTYTILGTGTSYA